MLKKRISLSLLVDVSWFCDRWSQGLIFHQAAVDCSRAVMLLPLALSHHFCQPVNQCSIIETVFLLLVSNIFYLVYPELL